eukprot:TRINITY_DN37728_c0_g1_i1.p1 TRINITY_DN37728_c0_g1~~TRINITY_DN37728_c0_g1_i1.p1  ORF type:complete len:521 (-),score=68.12 TRINITY_DN37728_c0_g1_i1:19-1581(-)
MSPTTSPPAPPPPPAGRHRLLWSRTLLVPRLFSWRRRYRRRPQSRVVVCADISSAWVQRAPRIQRRHRTWPALLLMTCHPPLLDASDATVIADVGIKESGVWRSAWTPSAAGIVEAEDARDVRFDNSEVLDELMARQFAEADSGRGIGRMILNEGRLCPVSGPTAKAAAVAATRSTGLPPSLPRRQSGRSVESDGGSRSRHDLLIVTVTAAKYEDTRARWVAGTWGGSRSIVDRAWRLHFISDPLRDARFGDDAAVEGNVTSSRLYGYQVTRIPPLPPWLSAGAEEDYSTHLYKFHLGLRQAFLDDGGQSDWYGLVGDDTYVDIQASLQALDDVLGGRDPARHMLCVGPLEENMSALVGLTGRLKAMLQRQCEIYVANVGGHLTRHLKGLRSGCEGSVVFRTAWLPSFQEQPQIYGAAIFCTRAAVDRLLPFLGTGMTLHPARLFLPIYRDFVPPADVVMNACIEDLGIAKVGIPYQGDGTPWSRGALSLRNLSGRPPFWHKVTTEADFEMLHFFHTRFV